MVHGPRPPQNLPPPHVLPDANHLLFQAYYIVQAAESIKEEEHRLAGEQYTMAVMLKFMELKDGTGELTMEDGAIYEEVLIEEEDSEETQENDSVEDTVMQ